MVICFSFFRMNLKDFSFQHKWLAVLLKSFAAVKCDMETGFDE